MQEYLIWLNYQPQGVVTVYSAESRLVNDPKLFSSEIKACFFDPIFENGPTMGYKILSQWESKGIIDGIVTTNIDYLHEIASPKNIADIWSDLNINYLLY